ncbi:MAG: glycosyltransferase family 4 protein [Spirochaetota bacterium]|nr:glycosyltransferase family 4 protein [Spirochaetota bacterium]
MKVLMYGWEFPPYVSGGLGTACFGISRGLIDNNVDITFVLPTKKGKGINSQVNIIGADEVPLVNNIGKLREQLKMINIDSLGSYSPYYTTIANRQYLKHFSSEVPTRKGQAGILEFTGNYGENLLAEVMNYSLAGESLSYYEDFDIIHAHDWLTFPAGVLTKNASDKPLIVHVHATEFDRSGDNINRDVYNIEKYGMDNADKIIAVSCYTKNIIVRHYGINPDKIEVIHNAVNKERQFERYGIKKNIDDKIVLYLGRVTMQKGPDYFMAAANQVLKKVKNVRFVMAGNGDLLPQMIYKMAEQRIADRFHFTGFLRGADVERMYAMSDLYVMPSVSEPFGLTPFEALVYDIPIIISKQSGASEILKHAICVDFWDVNRLADCIVAILNSEELSREIVKECQEEIKGVEWNTAGEKIKSIYCRLAA